MVECWSTRCCCKVQVLLATRCQDIEIMLLLDHNLRVAIWTAAFIVRWFTSALLRTYIEADHLIV